MKQTEYQRKIARESNTTHGMRYTRMYSIWCDMKKRCYNKKCKDYQLYGGKGIKVCDKWLTFEGFRDDMLGSYFNGASIERINNDTGYDPTNCKWIPVNQQGRNTLRTKLSLETIKTIIQRFKNGETQVSLAKEYNCHKSAIWRAINNKSWR